VFRVLRALSVLILLGVTAVLAVAFWPELLDLQRTVGFAQVVSLRGAAAAVAVGGALVVALLAAVIPPMRRFLGSLALLLLVFAVATAGLLASRGFGGPGFETQGTGDIRVLAWNTLGEAASAEAVARLAVENDADVVSLPESTEEFADEVAHLAAEQGLALVPHTVAYDRVAKARSTSLLISERLGDYDVSEDGVTDVLPSVVATSRGDGPTIVAVHAVAPILGELRSWRSDLNDLAALCGAPDIILAGDFNATLDAFAGLATPLDGGSADLGACSDAAMSVGAGAVGTWPAAVPPAFGAPIDHVMSGPAWRTTGFRVILDRDGSGSDHRPVLAQLSPAD
jgi:endonuclease/exonuclease/phosphatase (EEP) superfamily protein YafD